MRHLRTFESFQSINEEEEILGKVGAFFGKFNEESIKQAENLLNKTDGSLKTKNKEVIDFKKQEFQKFKSLHEKGDKNGSDVFKEIVQHLVMNKDIIYRVDEVNGKWVFRKGSRYGREGGTAAGGGGGA